MSAGVCGAFRPRHCSRRCARRCAPSGRAGPSWRRCAPSASRRRIASSTARAGAPTAPAHRRWREAHAHEDAEGRLGQRAERHHHVVVRRRQDGLVEADVGIGEQDGVVRGALHVGKRRLDRPRASWAYGCARPSPPPPARPPRAHAGGRRRTWAPPRRRCRRHASTSASSMCQASRGRARVPARLRDAIRPFADRSLNASRTTVRLAPKRRQSSISPGTSSCGLIDAGDDRRAELRGDARGARRLRFDGRIDGVDMERESSDDMSDIITRQARNGFWEEAQMSTSSSSYDSGRRPRHARGPRTSTPRAASPMPARRSTARASRRPTSSTSRPTSRSSRRRPASRSISTCRPSPSTTSAPTWSCRPRARRSTSSTAPSSIPAAGSAPAG